MKRTLIVLMAVVAIMIAGGASVTYASPDGKVTLCHAAGLDGTTHFVTLEVGWPAAYGPAGHFYENGTPRAGHERDYLGACIEPSPTPSPEPSPSPTPTFTQTPTSTPSPSDSPEPTPTPSSTPPSSPQPTPPQPTLPPTDTASPSSAIPSDLGYTIAVVVLAFAVFEVMMAWLMKRRS